MLGGAGTFKKGAAAQEAASRVREEEIEPEEVKEKKVATATTATEKDDGEDDYGDGEEPDERADDTPVDPNQTDKCQYNMACIRPECTFDHDTFNRKSPCSPDEEGIEVLTLEQRKIQMKVRMELQMKERGKERVPQSGFLPPRSCEFNETCALQDCSKLHSTGDGRSPVLILLQLIDGHHVAPTHNSVLGTYLSQLVLVEEKLPGQIKKAPKKEFIETCYMQKAFNMVERFKDIQR